MTDKQMMIDGVDVSGCEKQGETIAGITCGNGERIRLANEIITKHKLCKDNPNCVYKQLKRKEQKCEELINQRDKFEFGNNILEHERNKYKQALDEIEHQVTELFLGVENKDRTYCKKILDIINSVKDKNVPRKAKDGEQ